MRLERGEEWLCYEDLEELLAQAPGDVLTLIRPDSVRMPVIVTRVDVVRSRLAFRRYAGSC